MAVEKDQGVDDSVRLHGKREKITAGSAYSERERERPRQAKRRTYPLEAIW